VCCLSKKENLRKRLKESEAEKIKGNWKEKKRAPSKPNKV